jgi:hypothetical protein
MSGESQYDWGGVIFGVICAAVGFGFAYWAWPDGVTDKPLAALTLRDVFWVGASIFSGLFGLGGVGLAIRDA